VRKFQVISERLARDGENVLTVKKKNPFLANIVHFFSGFSLIMWVGAALCILSYKPLGDPPDSMNLGLAIVLFLCIIVMAIFNIVQEHKSNQVMKSILNMLPAQAIVIRNGAPQEILATQLVEGDVIELSVGRVPADVRIISARQLRVDNSVLTGETEPISCTTVSTNENYMETKNLLFLGTTITEGTGMGVVVATGGKTVMGFITTKTASSVHFLYAKRNQPIYDSRLHRRWKCGCHSVVLVGSLAAHVLPQLLEHLANDHYLRRCHRWFLA
jgi:sodium/potassium-transporting ATPase subunit alpha